MLNCPTSPLTFSYIASDEAYSCRYVVYEIISGRDICYREVIGGSVAIAELDAWLVATALNIMHSKLCVKTITLDRKRNEHLKTVLSDFPMGLDSHVSVIDNETGAFGLSGIGTKETILFLLADPTTNHTAMQEIHTAVSSLIDHLRITLS